MVMEAKKSQDLQLAGWRPRRANDIQVQWPKKQEIKCVYVPAKSEAKSKRIPMS